MASADALITELASLTPPEGKHLAYGTAGRCASRFNDHDTRQESLALYAFTTGFRDRAELLPSTFLRMGALAAVRSRAVAAVIGKRSWAWIVLALQSPEIAFAPINKAVTLNG
jgi:hypothetical protein